MPALDVLSLVKAKAYLNVRSGEDDVELAEFISAAVERVERHLAGPAGIGVTLTDAATVTALQLLAVKAVLGEYWRTQRVRIGRGTAASTAAAVEADSGPGGAASLRSRLTELLGPPFDGTGASPPAPVGSFPPPRSWPDPPVVRCYW